MEERGVAAELRQGPLIELEAIGYTIIEEVYDSKVFGNSYVTLKAEGFLIRFVAERGDYVLWFAVEEDPDDWCLSSLAAMVLSDEAEREDRELDIRHLSPVFQWFMKYESRIRPLFGPDRVVHTKQEMKCKGRYRWTS